MILNSADAKYEDDFDTEEDDNKHGDEKYRSD